MRVKSLAHIGVFLAAVSGFSASHAQAAAITAGHLVVVRVGDGTTTATGTALPVILDDYTVTYTGAAPTGVSLAQSIALPTGALGTAPSSGQRYLAQGGTAGGEGGLALSTNGLYMTLAGYNSGKGDPTNAATVGTEDRVIGRLDLAAGAVDTSTVLVGVAATTAYRGAASTNGSDIWIPTSAGIRYTTFGNSAGAGVSLTASTGNERRVGIFNNQLYTSRQSAPVDGIATVGTGTPTSGAGQTVTQLTGFPTTNTGGSPYDYFFADANTIYVSDDGSGSSTAPGLQKWTLISGTWTRAYNLPVSGVGIKSLTGYLDGSGNVVLFGSTTGTQSNFLYGFEDSLSNTNVANVTATKLVSAGLDYAGGALWSLRGVSVVPLPEPACASVLLFGVGLLSSRRRK